MVLSITSPGPNKYSVEVEQLQNNLLALGFPLSIDGYFGPETQQAVKDFQYTWGGLEIDGIVGIMTSAALDSAINLLYAGQWNTEMDPMEAPTTIAPTTITIKTATSTGVPKSTQVESILKNVDWVWIAIGIGASILVFKMIK